jgi:hypothetical protein
MSLLLRPHDLAGALMRLDHHDIIVEMNVSWLRNR